jgi:hypothetical protein
VIDADFGEVVGPGLEGLAIGYCEREVVEMLSGAIK